MSREIKFRAWDTGNKIMIHGVSHVQEHYIEVMQYTGLKDKNGVEIYEGDILRHSLWKIPVVVYWEYGGFMAKSVSGELGKRSYTDGTLYDMQLPKCKVIGNIYENPELLK